MLKQALVVLIIALVGCSDRPVPTSKEKREARTAARIKNAESVLNATPIPRTYRIDNNEIKVIEIPTVDSGGFVEVQRCFIWRDQEYKTSTMSCPAAQESPELPMTGSTHDSTHN